MNYVEFSASLLIDFVCFRSYRLAFSEFPLLELFVPFGLVVFSKLSNFTRAGFYECCASSNSQSELGLLEVFCGLSYRFKNILNFSKYSYDLLKFKILKIQIISVFSTISE